MLSQGKLSVQSALIVQLLLHHHLRQLFRKKCSQVRLATSLR